jgi:imidazolonepropionase-like amidohydrolase
MWLVCLLLTSSSSAETLVIKAGRLLDPESATIRENQAITIADGRIISVSDDAVTEGMTIIDLSSMTVMPGLMDAHTHLCMHDKGSQVATVARSTSYRAIQGVMNAKDMLEAGFTTVRDVGNAGNYADTALRKAIGDGLVPGPTMINAGRIISPFGGQLRMLPERSGLLEPEYYSADSRDEMRKAIRENAYYGAKVIKIVVDDNSFIYSEDDIRFIVKEARLAGMRVAAHVESRQGTLNAINAGVATIDHGWELDDELARNAAQKGIPLVSTAFSQPVIKANGWPDPEDEYRWVMKVLRTAYEYDVIVAFGSDLYAPVDGMTRGEAALTYIDSFVDAGASDMQILRAFTVNAMTAIGIEDRGLIKEGMAADIIAMPGNPLDGIQALKKVAFVMKNGKVIRSDAL